MASALANDNSVSSLPTRYPSGSIQSVETADRALADVAVERSAIEARFADDERACYSLFFANSCRDRARERRRLALAEMRPIEVEANAFKRRTRVMERDKALEEKRAKSEADRQQRLQEPEPKVREPKTARPSEKNPGKIVDGEDRQARHEEKLRRQRAEDAANAQKRAENVAAYERKVEEAEARQREVEARKNEKEKERGKK